MTIYYIEYEIDSQQKLFSFDSTSEIVLSDSGSVTSYRVETTESVSDHYVNNNVTVSLTGRISDIKSLTKREDDTNTYNSTQQFISELRALKHRAIPFKVYLGSNFGSVEKCVFESLEISQGGSNGTRVISKTKEVSAFRISFTAKQIRFGKRATSVAQPDPVIAPTVEPERPKAGQTQEPKKPWKFKFSLPTGRYN